MQIVQYPAFIKTVKKLHANAKGEISGNTAANSGYGGGVYVSGGTFTMNSGKISYNTVDKVGGGVFMREGTTFTMYIWRNI